MVGLPGTARLWGIALFVFMSMSLAHACAIAASVEVTVSMDGRPLSGAVVSLHPVDASPPVQPVTAEVDQRDFVFTPRVLVIPVGSSVEFPNRDAILHHVYSFSPAKPFELPLYSGRPSSPIVFDSPGVVVLGCNIHDTMIGYIVILDTPYESVTGDGGRTTIQAPAGEYVMQVWHEKQRHQGESLRESLTLGSTPASVEARVEAMVATPPPVADDRLNHVQQRFRALRAPAGDPGRTR
jgi:plastocyanin